jgi:cell division protein FtsI/penicillin-binding protein 2
VDLAASDGTAPVAALGSPRVCALPAMGGASTLAADYARWSVPPSLQAMLEPLESLRQPGGALYRAYTAQHGPNRVMLDGNAVDAGFSIALTIDPALQALAQKTAACYTGQQDVCRALGIHRAQDGDQTIGHLLLEGAMVRMAAIAVIDVASGRIEALAGALSPCTRQEFDGPGRDARCDKRLPYPVQYRPDALLNPAVYHDAMPASTIKPIMAAAFLTDRDVGALWLATEQRTMKPGTPPSPDSLRGQLMRSDSARFLDRMFCSEKNYADCGRPWTVQAMAKAFGWNAGCTDARADCGKQDLLFGRALDGAEAHAALRQAQGEREGIPGSTAVAFGRLMSEPVTVRGTAMHLFPRIPLRSDIVGRCALGADGRRRSEDDWTKCRGGAVVDVVAEGWGQGHARSSALGVAGMMATLAAAANGQAELHRPHLVEGVRGTDRTRLDPAALQWGVPDAQPNAVPHPAAEVILDALSYSHRYGTARTACEEVFDPRSCKGITWIAGKTGTPSFPNDGIGLDEIARACAAGANAQRDSKATCSSLRPYKWYVAAYRSEPGSPLWGKAIGVLTERNWLVRNGQVHGAGDHGPNPSAEIALQIVGRQLGVIQASAP